MIVLIGIIALSSVGVTLVSLVLWRKRLRSLTQLAIVTGLINTLIWTACLFILESGSKIGVSVEIFITFNLVALVSLPAALGTVALMLWRFGRG